jgi:flap endonuclease-1
MGIKNLNKFIKNNCNNSMKQITFYSLKNKIIVVDTSIYLYRFKSEDMLIDGFYNLITKFKYYNIVPIFIFDGKPCHYKSDELDKRKKNKIKAKLKYNEIKKNRKNKRKLLFLKKKFVSVTKEDIYIIKSLLRSMNIYYYNAPCEADILCAKLVINNIAYACLSDDMDLLAYGCPRVLRYLSLMNLTMILYNLNIILNTLDINLETFKIFCILSGTDYNTGLCTFEQSNNYFNTYTKLNNNNNFNNWLLTNKIINNDIDEYLTLFNSDNIDISKYDREYKNKSNNKNELINILEKYDYIFI